MSNLSLMSNSNRSFDPREMQDMALGAVVTSSGIISIRLHNDIRVDITANKGIRLVNSGSKIIVAVSPSGNSSALIHPTGKVYQYGSRVELATGDYNLPGNCKLAKLSYKGVTFTTQCCPVIYLVDQAGTRTTSDVFSDMDGDFSMLVFLNDAHHGPKAIAECVTFLKEAQYWITSNGIENWIVNGIRVSQYPDGLVRVGRGTNKYFLSSSANGTANLNTPYVHSTASTGLAPGMNSNPHVFVKRGEQKIHYDGKIFTVRHAGHSAGFDERNKLKVY